MKQKKILKVLTSALVMGTVFFTNTVCAQAAWKQDNYGWWYEQGGTYFKDCWKEINGKW